MCGGAWCGGDAVVLPRGGCIATVAAFDTDFDTGVFVGHHIGCGRGDAVVAVGFYRAGEALAIDKRSDDVTCRESTRDKTRQGDVARHFCRRDDVVARDGVQADGGGVAGVGEVVGVGLGGVGGHHTGGQSVVGNGLCSCAASAGGCGKHSGVGVVDQICSGYVDAVAAVDSDRARECFAVDAQCDHVASGKGALHPACDSDKAASGFSGIDEVVARNGVDKQGGGVGAGRSSALDHKVLEGVGFVAIGALHLGFDFAIGIGGQLGAIDPKTEGAVCGSVDFVSHTVDEEGDLIACSKCTTDSAGDGDRARSFLRAQDVVARNGVEVNGGSGAFWGLVVGVEWAQGGVEHIVLLSRGGLTAAGDAGFNGGVDIVQKVGRGHAAGEVAVAVYGGSEGFSVEHKRDGASCGELACDPAA